MDDFPGLTNDLWAHVFSYVAKLVSDELRTAYYKSPLALLPREEYNQLHSLRLVCKNFNLVFLEHPQLSAKLLLGAQFSAKAFLSLLKWMQQDSTVVEELLATCGGARLEATLSGAIAAANKPLQSLKRAVVGSLSDSAANMLASCANLSSCCFGCFYFLDLEPLQALPYLSELSLHTGVRASGVGKLAQLTGLDLHYVEVQCGNTAQFTHGLKRLSANKCILEGLHDLGLAACSSLQELSLAYCCILPLSDQYALSINLGVFTHRHDGSLTKHLSDLTQLTKLEISGTVKADFYRPSVFLLTNLVYIDLGLYLQGDHEVIRYILTDHLGVLHSLEHFALRLSAPKGLILVLEVSWHLMLLLQTVTISAPCSMCDERILGFAKLTALKCLKLKLGELADDVTAYWYNFLMYNMSTGRHDTFPLNEINDMMY